MTNIMTILPKICFPARWLVRAVIQNQDTRFPTEAESGFGIRDSQVKSSQSRLIRDAWTLCKGLGGPGACFPGKNLKFEVFKLLEMH